MGRTPRKHLEKYKTLFNYYYNNINNLKPNSEEDLTSLTKLTKSFLETYSTLIKKARGMSENYKKIDITRLDDENYVNGLLEGISDSSRIKEAKATIADFNAKFKCLDEVSEGASSLLKFFDGHKDFNQDAVSEFEKKIFPSWGKIYNKHSIELIKFPSKKIYYSSVVVNSSCKKMLNESKSPALADYGYTNYIYIKGLRDSASNSVDTLEKDIDEERKLIKAELKKFINGEEEYNNLQEIKKNSLTLSGIKLAEKQPTLENITAVIERSRKNHPIVLGAISRKINSKLKSLKFKKLDFSQVN